MSKQHFNLHFAFTAHDQVRTVQNFMKKIADADVVCTEMSGWEEVDQKILQAVADGRYAIKEALGHLWKSGFAHEENVAVVRCLLERIFDSKKLIFFADVPNRDKQLCLELADSNRYLLAIDDLCKYTFEGEFERAVKECRVLLAQFLQVHQKREGVIMQRLTQVLPEVTQTAPVTRDKSDIHVAISLGMGHSPMLGGFQKTGFELSRSFPDPIQFMDSTIAALRALRARGKRGVISEEVLARVLFENHVILPLNMWPRVPKEVTRVVAHTFSLTEIQAMFAATSFDPTPKGIKAVARQRLTDKGVPISQDPVEWIAYVDTLCSQRKWPAYVSDTLRFPLEQQMRTESLFTKVARQVKRTCKKLF